MKPSILFKLKLAFLFSCCAALVFLMGGRQLAQTRTPLPERKGHVNDFAGAIDETRRQQLENILSNVKLKTGIEFDIAVVETTEGEDIFEFSRRLAANWGVGKRTSTRKSLLLVVSVNDKSLFTQFSRSVQPELPDGILGEMSQRMRGPINSGQVNEGISTGVQYFVSALGNKLALNTDDWDKAPETITASGSTEVKEPGDAAVTAIATPSPAGRSRTVSRRVPRENGVAGNTRRPVSSNTAEDDADESEEVELTLTLPLPERVIKLKQFINDYPDSKSRLRAFEILVSAHAGIGDDKLKKGETATGIEQFMLAIAETPPNSSDQLFTGVVAQIPMNLYLRGERAAAMKAAQAIEAKFSTEAKRLLAVSNFYAATEQADDAARVASQAVKLAPDLADAHHALGRALQISLRLNEAAAEYKRALELDPTSKTARRGLADLNRALGQPEEALALDRQQLLADPADKAAHAGLVISLLDLRRSDEAKEHLDTALKNDPRNLPLLAGAAYWYAAHDQNELALDLGTKAVEIEPRYTWSHIALARALVTQKKPLEAERAIRFARLYGKFPTLEYELASALVSAGLYDEAAEVLLQTFNLKDNQIETRLAGRTVAQASNFIELLAPERLASIYQSKAADSEENARVLKSLLNFATLMQTNVNGARADEPKLIAAAKDFASGDDNARVHRQIYVASRLLKIGTGFQTVYELAEAARSSAEAGLNVPVVTLVVQADEFRDIRARAIAEGGTPSIPEAPLNLLSNLLRGRIEDLSGWALFNQDKVEEAVNHLRRAANILPEGTPAWRTALWHLGTALDQAGNKEEALGHYIRSYAVGDPDPVRRALIEDVYRKVYGSLAGLDERIGRAADVSANSQPPAATDPATTTAQPAASPDVAGSTAPAVSAPVAESTPTPALEVPPAPSPAATPVSETPSSPEPQASPTASPETPAPTPEPTPASTVPAADSPVGEMIPPRRQTVTITGRVKDANDQPLANVVVVLISPQGTVLASTTDDKGNYSFKVAASELNYRIIPSKTGFTFQPVDKVLQGATDDQKELNFVGTANPSP